VKKGPKGTPRIKGRIKADTLARAKDRIARLGGQVKALWNMAEGRADWKKLLTLAAAVQGASDEIAAELYQGYLESLADGKSIAGPATGGVGAVIEAVVGRGNPELRRSRCGVG
jgi:DNA-binding FrmR family transcriptional regulator